MCGISGYYGSTSSKTGAEYKLVMDIVASQHSRGPDHNSVQQMPSDSSTIIFGHNRLSIIDLSEAGNQPMWDSERTHCVTYNGEIYNYLELKEELTSLGHSFRTQSDTEVLLAAFKHWGPLAFSRLNGMFAIAIYRHSDKRLWLVRDRFGVKPLYYHLDKTALWFASTGTVIANILSLAPNLEYVARGLKYWLYEDDTDISPYDGLKALKAGHYLEVTCNGADRTLAATEHRYYDLASNVMELTDELARAPISELVENVQRLLSSAVDLRLRSDVPVGVSLSGGLDSSAIAAMLAERKAKVVGFTFGSPDDQKSEGPIVKELQDKLGIDVKYIVPSSDELREAFWACLKSQDAPYPNASVTAQYLVFKAAKEHGIKVLLGGQGGDESFMGYRKFYVFYLAQLAKRKEPYRCLVTALNVLRLMMAELSGPAGYLKSRHRYTNADGIQVQLRLPELPASNLGFNYANELWKRQLSDITQFSIPTLLRYEDRNSMGNSIESRLPFMDYRVVELGLALPVAVKLRNGYGKWIVREAMKGRLPESIRSARYKRGFGVNEVRWVTSGLGDSIRQALHERHSRVRDILPCNTNIDEVYSDERLYANGSGIAEAISLIWLGDRL